MSRYKTATGSEAELEPGTRSGVLRNLRQITSKRDMDQAEFQLLLEAQTAWWSKVSTETRFTAKTLCDMHRDWLGGLYNWAGKYRTVEMAKNGFRWPPAHLVDQNMRNLEAGLLRKLTPFKPGSLEEVCSNAAAVHAELLFVHPFREGNGRVARWLADLCFLQAGLVPPDHGFSGSGSVNRRGAYLEAVKRGYLGDLAGLAAFFAEGLERSASANKPFAPSKRDEP